MTSRPSPSRAGRVAVAPWALTALALVTSFTLARWYQRTVPERPDGRVLLQGGEAWGGLDGLRVATGWEARFPLESGDSVRVVVTPFTNAGEKPDFRAQTLRDRLGRTEGDLFRVLLSLEGAPQADPEAGEAEPSEEEVV